MLRTVGSTRPDAVKHIALIALASLSFVACDKSSTAPTPVATSLVLNGGGAQTATVNTALAVPVVLQVNDQAGNPMSGVTVSFTTAANSGAISHAQVTSDANGLALVSWTLGTVAGTDSLVASIGGSAVTVVATATPDAPAAITVMSGNDQSAPAGTSLSGALSVKVTDQYGNAVPNVTVTWSTDASGSLASQTSITDANGVAQDSLTLGPSAGTNDVSAAVTAGSSSMTATFVEQAM